MSTLTLSGWTQPTDAVAQALAPDANIFDYSEYATPEASFAGLEAFKNVENIIAWSLGGQLAVRAIAAGVLRPKHLTVIAPPYQFVQAGAGMDTTTFTLFRENYASDPARTKQRFHALVAKGDRDMRRILPLLGHHHAVEDTARWLPWLDDLGATSLDKLNLSALPRTLLVQGVNDAIVPAAQAERFANHAPQITVERWDDVSHAPHMHDAARLTASIVNHRGQA